MRRVIRPPLPKKTHEYLMRRQRLVTTSNAESLWNSSRQTQTIGKLLKLLQGMMGARERCMYCVDSHGSDIDHFRPKARFHEYTFDWLNMILCCTECGRLKGAAFPVEGSEVLLVDPTLEEPWDYIDFDPDTGNLTPRFSLTSGQYSRKGLATVNLLRLDKREGMAEGLRRSYRRIVARVEQAIEDRHLDGEQLAEDLVQLDDHGLLGWCFADIDLERRPFSTLRVVSPSAWELCARAAQCG